MPAIDALFFAIVDTISRAWPAPTRVDTLA